MKTLSIVLGILISGLLSAAPLSLEDIASLKSVTSVRMSPNGDRIAYLQFVQREVYVEDDGRPYHELHVVDLEGNSTPFVTGKVDIGNIAWAPDGGSLYFVAKRDPEAKFNSIWNIRMSGGEASKVFTHVNSIGSIHPSPDGNSIAFTATEAAPEADEDLAKKGFKAVIYEESVQPSLIWILDLESGEAVEQDLDGHASSFTWSADGSHYAVALAPTPLIDDSFTSQDVYFVETETADVQGKLGSVGKLGSFAISPDGERIAYIGSVDINDPANGRLYVASSSGGERRELVTEYMGHITDFAWQDDVNLRWVGHRGVWSEMSRASIMAAGPAGDPPMSGPIIRSINTHAGMDVVAVIADTPEHPPEVYLYRDGDALKRLTNSNPWLSERELVVQEPIAYPARDGLEIQAVLMRPAERERGGNPLIIYVHGGPEAHHSNGWLTSYSLPGQTMAGDGYTVVYPNYRGSTGRGVEFSKLDQHDYAEEEFNDLVDAKTYLVNAGLADADRVGISGGSYGGYATMWGATALSEEFAAAVAFVGISNQVSKFGTGDIPYEMYYVHSLAWPWDDWMWMLQRSPVYHAGSAKTPLLIMGGDQDARVHPSQSLEMYRHIKLRTDTPVRLVIYPGEVHGNRNSAARYDYSIRSKRWMDHYLKGPGGEPPSYDLDHAARMEASADE
ncbi:MAG: prolyl oligopeptidase family serine peptidase [Gammaproteobacteria bacterium]|nr:prolyl oligopeptidase family serine peptidase [Gammaproteobacteria bacterium]